MPVEIIKHVPVEVIKEVEKEVPPSQPGPWSQQVTACRDESMSMHGYVQVIRDVPREMLRAVEVVCEVPVEVTKILYQQVPKKVVHEVRACQGRLESLPTFACLDLLAT